MSEAPPTLPPQVSPPQFAVSSLRPDQIGGVDAVALPVLGDDEGGLWLGPGAAEAAQAWDTDLVSLCETAAGPGPATAEASRAGAITPTAVATSHGPVAVYFVGVGQQTPDDLRRAGAALARATKDRDLVASTVAAVSGAEGLQAFVVGMMLGAFSFDLRSAGPASRPAAKVVCAGHADAADRDSALARGVALGGASWRSRVLATVPANIKDPAWLAGQAEALAQESGLAVSVWDEKRLAREGMGGILAVGAGSASPPRLIRLDYKPRGAGRRTPRIVLVGKGITFDSGGLQIKPHQGMVTMKRDMTGGAVVLSVMGALGVLGCPVRVTGLIPAAENAIGQDAMRPGDVITHYGGRTSEVTNTDAEGRLVMADALAYAAAELDPAVLVDVATLTGGIKIALGQSLGGLFATSDALADALLEAGVRAGEPLWRMPLAHEYEDRLASKVADADNGPTSGPQSIMAALFLEAFTAGLPWAHLDVASVGDARKDEYEYTDGPTGFGARALLTWLTSDPLARI